MLKYGNYTYFVNMGFAQHVSEVGEPYLITIAIDIVISNLQSDNEQSVKFALETLDEFRDYMLNVKHSDKFDIDVDDVHREIALDEMVEIFKVLEFNKSTCFDFNSFVKYIVTRK